ncbi:hypothetical protein KM043_006034 [Ampulex compressa]|nr:hypothetical protein KM043_006034 [Ampulex compressa]
MTSISASSPREARRSSNEAHDTEAYSSLARPVGQTLEFILGKEIGFFPEEFRRKRPFCGDAASGRARETRQKLEEDGPSAISSVCRTAKPPPRASAPSSPPSTLPMPAVNALEERDSEESVPLHP